MAVPSPPAKILLDYDSTHVRLFFRIYFLILSLIISVVGNQSCANSVKVRLLRGRRVQLAAMTGWLQNFGPIFAIKSLHALPGGWFGVLMICSAFLNLGSDLVSTVIQVQKVQDRCPFGTGLVITDQDDFGSQVPPHNGAPYFVVAQSQITSQSNGGLVGIYVKANGNLNFCADASDVLGSWSCSGYQTALEYPSSVSVEDIVSNMVQQGYFYDLPDPPSYSSIYHNGLDILNNHLVILDSSAGANLQDTFDVRIAVDVSPLPVDTKVMESYECKLQTMNATDLLESIQRAMWSRETLLQWAEVVPGTIYYGSNTPASNNTQHLLEQVLNSMMMVAGGDNYLLGTSPENDSQGCVTPRTYVPWEVVALAAVVALLAGCLILYWIYTLVRIRSMGPKIGRDRAKAIKQLTPGDVFTWMVQAVRESQDRSIETRGRTEKMKPKRLRDWEFGNQDNGGLGVMRKVLKDGRSEEYDLVPQSHGAARNDEA